MASIFSLATRMFRTRNPARDASTDAERVNAVRQSILDAVDSAMRERDGLKRRVDEFYTHASALMDESGEYGERSQKDETAISEAEFVAAAARRRIAAVNTQIEQFHTMLKVTEPKETDRQNVA